MGQSFTNAIIAATKEVILAAGAFRSPQLLMVSGIGPSATLEQLDIPIISKSEGVGQGVWDQPLYSVTYKVNVTTQSQLLVNPDFIYKATEDYLTTQTGPLDSAGGNWVGKLILPRDIRSSVLTFLLTKGWEKLPQTLRSGLSNLTISDLAQFPSDWPELELLPLADTTAAVTDTGNYFSVSIAVLATTSRGNVTINSTDTKDNPLVSPNWLLTTTDQELAVQGFKRAREIANATGITVGPETSPGAQIQTDAQILEYIKQDLAPIHHASAACAMGGNNDSNAVVDTKGRVYGVQSLRIVDASIFPLLPPGHPQSTLYMLAVKIADDIMRDN
ncbi:hypothetical protein MMC28_008538 [Mycoblastus sanguinarius]|nr:hypothetical protein [Mycoblastus sanguinarius]